MEALAHKLAKKIACEMDYDENKRAVIAYGLTAMLQMATIFTLISVIGMLFDFWYESMLIFFGVGIIRKSTGGAHSHTMTGCIFISVFSIVGLASLSKYLLGRPVDNSINIVITVLIFVLCYIVFYIRVPVDSPKKPIVKPEKIKRLRNQSYMILSLFFLISIIFIISTAWNNRFYSLASSIRMMMLWQMFTLTKTGAHVLNIIDLNFQISTEKG